MSRKWEKLCDGCANCCEIPGTGVACPYLDTNTRLCTVYDNRFEKASWCLKVTPENTLELHARKILPASCAYVRHKTALPPLDEVPVAKLIPYTMADSRVHEIHKRLIKRAPIGALHPTF